MGGPPLVDKLALMARVRQLDAGKRRRHTEGGTAKRKEGRGATSFADLPEYQLMKTQRAAADMFGVENPFFRSHEARAGATATIGGKEFINFASYDYLGLNAHPAVAEAAKAAIDQYGTSASASRIVAGERDLHRKLEAAIAEVYEVEDAVVFVSGHATNVATISQLMGPKDLVIYDEFIHNSVLVGAQLSGAARRSFPHNDYDALERILSENRSKFEQVMVITEGLYSMDGDLPDLPVLIDIKNRHAAWLMVDEAHGLGVLGETGRGIAEHFGVPGTDVDIWMGTLSKTCAGCGGFIAGTTALVETLKFQAPGFVYSVGMSPPVAGAALAAIKLIAEEPERVGKLRANSLLFKEVAQELGLDTGHAMGYAVVPVMVGDSLRATKLTQMLFERGINVLPIIYPAVPMQSARLRFFITSEHTEEQLREAAKATAEELEKLEQENFGIGKAAARLAPKVDQINI